MNVMICREGRGEAQKMRDILLLLSCDFFIFVIGNALEIEIEHVDKSKTALSSWQ